MKTCEVVGNLFNTSICRHSDEETRDRRNLKEIIKKVSIKAHIKGLEINHMKFKHLKIRQREGKN